jgi:hypothetical protein
MEAAAEKYLGIKPVDTMVQFGMLPRSDASFKITAMTG